MYPFIHIGRFSIGTFGIMLWLAAVCACWVLHRNFRRWKIDADAIGIVAISTVIGVIGAKLWHVLETPQLLMQDPAGLLFDRAGFAWFGGLVAGIIALLWQGRSTGLSKLGMLDLAAPAAAVGYGVGRIGCLTSGDGDYGIPTTLPWGVHMAPDALVPTTALVHPTPVYELLFSLALGWLLWQLGKKYRPVGWMTGLYLVLSGLGRFLVEFVRINPKLYLGMSNAQVAALGSMVVGLVVMVVAGRRSAAVQPVVEVSS